MKANFALSLSFEGIRLLHRAAGGWRLVGEASLEGPDLNNALKALRKTALGLEPAGLRTKLVVPNDQIKYLTIDTPGLSDEDRRVAALRALDGATPYPVNQLAFDICPDDNQTHVAAIARETLVEAEGFAVEHRFAPISVVAIPEEESGFLGEPFFGPTRHAIGLVPPGDGIEPDNIAVVVVGDLQGPNGPVVEVDDTANPVSEPQIGAFEALSEADTDITPDTFVPDKQLTDIDQGDGTQPRFPLPPIPKAPTTPSVSAPEIILDDGIDVQPDDPVQIGFASRRGKAEPVRPGARDEPPLFAAPVVDAPVPAQNHNNDVSNIEEHSETAGFDGPREVVQTQDADRPSRISSAMPAAVAARLGALGSKSKTAGAPSRKPPASLQKNMQRLAAQRPERKAESQARINAHNAEKQRLTVFGARKPADPAAERARPRFLGLILTAMLLLFLAGLAAWLPALRDTSSAANLFTSEDEPVPETQPVLAQPVPDSTPDLNDDPVDAPVLPAPKAVEQPPLVEDSRDVAALDLEPETQTEPLLPQPKFAPKPEEYDPDAAQEHYAVTGIWTIPPTTPETPGILSLENLYLTSIDRTDLDFDAVALEKTPGFDTDLALLAPANPPPPGTEYELDTRGFVVATPEGSATPEGALVFAGRPVVVPGRIPERAETPVVVDTDRAILAIFRPRLRPSDLQERTERSNLGGLSRAELGLVRPQLRPARLQTDEPEETAPVFQSDPALAGTRPNARPRGFAAIVQRTKPSNKPDTQSTDTTVQTAAVAPQTVSPRIPSSASVAKQATLKNAINLKKINLMGVYGTPSNRRALIRMSNGRYKKVKVGDRIDGGRVSAIGESELRYQKSGRNITLTMPKT